jgi:hypothetical protein
MASERSEYLVGTGASDALFGLQDQGDLHGNQGGRLLTEPAKPFNRPSEPDHGL